MAGVIGAYLADMCVYTTMLGCICMRYYVACVPLVFPLLEFVERGRAPCKALDRK